jgi:hypothetical protein
VIQHFRLRYEMDRLDRGPGASRPHGLDLTPHDVHAHLFGAFFLGRQIAAGRMVWRTGGGPAAHLVRSLIEALEPSLGVAPTELPGERSFDFGSTFPDPAAAPLAEIGRIFVRPGFGDVERALLVAMIGFAVDRGIPEAIAVCAADRVPSLARICSVRLAPGAPSARPQAEAGLVFDLDPRLMPGATRVEVNRFAAHWRAAGGATV